MPQVVKPNVWHPAFLSMSSNTRPTLRASNGVPSGEPLLKLVHPVRFQGGDDDLRHVDRAPTLLRSRILRSARRTWRQNCLTSSTAASRLSRSR